MWVKQSVIFVISLFISSLHAADKKELVRFDTTALIKEWIQLAHDLHAGNVGYFHLLPLDVQENIFSRIHPQPGLDDWQSNNGLCIQEMKVPHCIGSFDTQYNSNCNRLAYMAQKEALGNYYPFWIDLDTEKWHALCEKGIGFSVPNRAPIVQWCSDRIICESGSADNKDKMDLKAIDIFDRPLGGRLSISYLPTSSSVLSWATHKNLPLCAVMHQNGMDLYIKVFRISTSIETIGQAEIVMDDYDLQKLQHFTLTWHSSLPQLHIYNPVSSLIYVTDGSGKFDTQCKLHNAQSKPHFSAEGNTLYTKHKYGLLRKYDIGTRKEIILPRRDTTDDFVLHGVGYTSYLAEGTAMHGEGNGKYVLRSFEDLDKEVPLSEFDHAPKLCKLPSSDDYRYITIVPDKDKSTSTIKIFVPKTKVLFQHYCMLNAALHAHKHGSVTDWKFLTDPKNKELVCETKKGYALFSSLMAQKGH